MPNLNAEKLLLSGFIRHPDTFFELSPYLTTDDFSGQSGYSMIFDSIKSLYINKEVKSISKSSIIAEARALGYNNFLSLTKNGEIIDNIFQEKISQAEVSKWFLEIKRQTIIAKYKEKISDIENYLTTTNDPLNKIVSRVEEDVVQAVQCLDYGETVVKSLTKDLEKFVKGLAEQPGHLGIDFGFPLWQSRIGQVRNSSVTFIAASAKSGKSSLGLRLGLIAAHKLNLPVLLIDTELSESDQKVRAAGMMAEIPYDVIETGAWKFTEPELIQQNVPEDKRKILLEYRSRMLDQHLWNICDKLPIDYLSISGSSLDDVIPHIRRWVLTKAKPDRDAKFPQCLIIYDYLKLSNLDELRGGKVAEWQLHGLNYAKLHNIAKQYNLPILCFGQTNNELDDDIRCIAGAKRIVENVTSVSYLKPKNETEKALDPSGSHMLKIFVTRHGSGLKAGGYINIDTDLSCGIFKEINIGTVNFAEEAAKKIDEWKKNKRKSKKHDDADDDSDEE